MKTPWSYVEYDNRVYVLDADGRRMTEIIPGQRGGVLVTHAERVDIAKLIVAAVSVYNALRTGELCLTNAPPPA